MIAAEASARITRSTLTPTQPTCVLTTPSGTVNSAFVVTATFSQSVTGLTAAEIVIPASCSISGFSGSGTTYTFTITPTVQGNIPVYIPDSAAQNGTINNILSNTLITVYTLSPIPLGIVYTDNFNRGVIGSEWGQGGAGTVFSQNGAFLRTTTPVAALNINYMQLRVWPGPTNTQGVTGEAIKKIMIFRQVAGTTTGMGLGLGWRNISGNVAAGTYNLTGVLNTGAGYITQFDSTSTEIGSRQSFATSDGDRLRLTCDLELDVFTVTIDRLDGSGNVLATVSSTYTFGKTVVAPVTPTLSNLAVYFIGGTFDLEKYTITYQSSKFSRIIFVGDSVVKWYSAGSVAARYENVAMAGRSGTYTVIAGVGHRTAEVMNNVNEVLAHQPLYVFLSTGSNDVGTGVPTATWKANFQTITNTFLNAGILMVIATPAPRPDFDLNPLRSWIITQYTPDSRVVIVDLFTLLLGTGFAMNPAYCVADGLHLNATGATLVGNYLISQIPTILGP